MKHPRGYKADEGWSYVRLASFASKVREHLIKHLGLPLGPLDKLPGVRLFERLDRLKVNVGGKTFGVDFGTTSQLGASEIARTVFNKEQGSFWIELTEPTYSRLHADIPHARFSLFHEVAHLALHPGLIYRMGTMPHRAGLLRGAESGHELFYDTEWQADALAAYIMCPTEGIRLLEETGNVTAESLVEAYGLSNQSAEIRLGNFRRYRV